MARAYAYALQVAGVPTIYGSHSSGPTLTYSLSASTPSYGFVGSCIDAESALTFDRTLAGEASGVVTIDALHVRLLSKRRIKRDTAADPGRVFGRGGFDGVEWFTTLAESVARDSATPAFDIVDPGASVPSIVYVGREAMEVTYANPTVTVAKRAVLGTPRLLHNRDPDSGDVPYLTPQPLAWRGARVNLWRATVRADGSLGTWVVRFRGDIAEDPTDDGHAVTLTIAPITARLTQPLATDNRILRLSRLHTWSGDVGTKVAVYAWAGERDLFEGDVAVQANIGDSDIELTAQEDGTAGYIAHQDVSDITNLPQGHPRTVPVQQRPRWVYDVTGYTAPNLDVSPNIVGRNVTVTNQVVDTLRNAPIGESTLLELVDTSGGVVVDDGAPYLLRQFADTSKFGIGNRTFAISDGTEVTASWARVVRAVGQGSPVWRITSKVQPARKVTIGLSDRYAAGDIVSMGLVGELPGLVDQNCWLSGAQQSLEDAAGGRPDRYASPFLSPLVWSWSDPESVEAMRASLNGQRNAESRVGFSVNGVSMAPGQAVALTREGESIDVPASQVAPRWYQAGEEYITLDGPTGVGASGRVVIEVRRESTGGGSPGEIVGRCIAIGETQLSNGDYRVQLEIPASADDDFALPTIIEGAPGATDRFVIQPAFVAENVTGGLGEIAAQLITSGGGDGINSTYDTAPFGAQLLDGDGTLGAGDMGADVDIPSILALPSIAGADISVIGRPSSEGRDGDSVLSLLAAHLEATGYVLDMAVNPNPVDPFDGCLLVARPVRRPTPQEIVGTLGESDIVSMTRVGVEPVNAFTIGVNHDEGGKPQIVVKPSFSASVNLYGERSGRKLEAQGTTFPTVSAAVNGLRPYLTRLRERAFPQPRYEIEARTSTVRDLGLSYGSAIYVTRNDAPLPDGTLGLSVAACRVVSITLNETRATSTVVVDYYGTVARGRAPACVVIDYVDASTVKVATNFAMDLVDPATGAAATDIAVMLSTAYGASLGVGTPIIIRQRGDVDTTRRMQVAAFDTVAMTIQVEDDPAEAVYGDAHNIADPGAEQAPEDYIAVIEPRETATAPADHSAYFTHGRDKIA